MDSSDSDEVDTLQELFATNKLKPGLNIPVEKKVYANNITGINEKLKGLENNLPWSERMDIINEQAPIAPELSVELNEQQQFLQSGRSDSIALNEFKRETMFHRQAQAAVLEGIAKMRSLKIPTIRPDDYFAEMMKSDAHMQKIRKSILQKKAGIERSEKIKKMRSERKLAKKKQTESVLKKQKEKRQLSEDIKKYRKGVKTNLDFLEDNSNKNKRERNERPKPNKKRQRKNEKFGFGGKKKGLQNKHFKSKGAKKNMRPGKSKRMKMKKR